MKAVVSTPLVRRALATEDPSADWVTHLVNELPMDRELVVSSTAAIADYPVMSAEALASFKPDLTRASYSTLAEFRLLIGRDQTDTFSAVITRPFCAKTSLWLTTVSPRVQKIYLADPLHVSPLLERYETTFSAVADAIGPPREHQSKEAFGRELSLLSIQGEVSPAVRLVSSTIFDALRLDASDIHLEALNEGLVIKFRIDGVLNSIGTVNDSDLAEQTIARIKVLAELDIAEKRIPQDGRFRVAAKGRDIDIRVSIMPSIHGEDAVLRILDKEALIASFEGLTLNSLGLDAQTIALLRRLSAEPYGMMLVTGPTGSGKTTTLYAALSEINTGEDKIITIEDPVEYQLPGVLQIPVNEKKGLTFAVGLRSILRHDPDKILVGEIRDPETAQIAVQSALTGHMVFTSVHANNAFDVIGRFIHMGVDPYNFVSSLTGVVAQRLVRQICTACAEPIEIDSEALSDAGIFDAAGYAFHVGRGCGVCRQTGYKGRRAIAEVLRLNDELRELIIARASIRTLKERARANGMRFLRDVALDLVAKGQTTLTEANRVTFVA